jgi:hypothetical protein
MAVLERRAAWAMVGLGVASVVGGGLASAATALAPTEHTAWAVAYLVLVGGVAQVGLGVAQILFSRPGGSGVATLSELALWNVGNAAVLAGVLAATAVLVDLGGALLVVALALAVYGVRGARGTGGWRIALFTFRALVVVLLLSIPAGLLLARFGVG